MDDLIRRKDAVSRISDLLILELRAERLPTWNEVYNALAELPSAQQERKKGKWMDQYQDGDWHCSCCGAIVEKEEQILHNWYFCYHCGADMREETADE